MIPEDRVTNEIRKEKGKKKKRKKTQGENV
jgi:hypothetical protein